MSMQTLMEKTPAWVEPPPGEPRAVWTQCTLARNLADYPFPWRCDPDQKAAIEERVLNVLDTLNLLAHGHYYSLLECAPLEARLLAERQLITSDLLGAEGPCGVYVSEDQQLCIMVNAANHLTIRSRVGGLQPQEAWAQINLLDDTLGGMLDYAWQKRLGFLTTELSHIGSGLKVGAIVHLPALTALQQFESHLQEEAFQGLEVYGLAPAKGPQSAEMALPTDALYADFNGPHPCPWNETRGDLYQIINQHSLGVAEEESVFKVRQAANSLIAADIEAAAQLLEQDAPTLEDRIGRARGVAERAHLMEFNEAMGLLSSMRLGLETGRRSSYTIGQLNALLLEGQGAHLLLACNCREEEAALNQARADLFRSRIGAH